MTRLFHLLFLNYHEWRGARAQKKLDRAYATSCWNKIFRYEFAVCHHDAKLRHHLGKLSP